MGTIYHGQLNDLDANGDITGVLHPETSAEDVLTSQYPNKTNVGAALSDIDSRLSSAASAASSAASAAASAQSTANSAATAASNAATAASNAQNTANSAATAASNAQNTANSAVSAASAAQSKADDAYWYGTTAYNQINNGGVNVIRSIQRGTATNPTYCQNIGRNKSNGQIIETSTYLDPNEYDMLGHYAMRIDISSVNVNKSFVVLDSSSPPSNSPNGSDNIGVYVSYFDGSLLLVSKRDGMGTSSTVPVFSWQVIEYI